MKLGFMRMIYSSVFEMFKIKSEKSARIEFNRKHLALYNLIYNGRHFMISSSSNFIPNRKQWTSYMNKDITSIQIAYFVDVRLDD